MSTTEQLAQEALDQTSAAYGGELFTGARETIRFQSGAFHHAAELHHIASTAFKEAGDVWQANLHRGLAQTALARMNLILDKTPLEVVG